MVKVTSLTFVIGAAASEAVLHQLRHSPVSWDVHRSPAGRIGESIERRFIASPLAFELQDDVRRLVWRSSDSSCGILYIVQADQLKTINLFLGGATSVESLEMCQLAAAFDSIGYGKCLAMIDSVPRPLIASFHCGLAVELIEALKGRCSRSQQSSLNQGGGSPPIQMQSTGLRTH